MKKVIFMSVVIFAMTFASCGRNSKSSESYDTDTITPQGAVTEQSSDVSYTLKSAAGLPMLADFSAEWCPPCRQMKPVFRKLQDEFERKYDLVTIDVDENPELAQHYNVTSIPTLIYISPSGKELYRTVGLQTESIIRADINKYLRE